MKQQSLLMKILYVLIGSLISASIIISVVNYVMQNRAEMQRWETQQTALNEQLGIIFNEPWNELKNNSELPLSVDPYLMFRYVAPVYFFVSKNNPVGDVIESTLMQMIDNGELERLFFQDKEVQQALTRANVAQRTIFNLTNPNLPAGTPINDSRLWYNPAKEN